MTHFDPDYPLFFFVEQIDEMNHDEIYNTNNFIIWLVKAAVTKSPRNIKPAIPPSPFHPEEVSD